MPLTRRHRKGLPTHRRPHFDASFDFRLGSLGWVLLVGGRSPCRSFGQPRNNSNPQEGVKRAKRRLPACKTTFWSRSRGRSSSETALPSTWTPPCEISRRASLVDRPNPEASR